MADFRPTRVRDKEDFEKQLYQRLDAKLGGKAHIDFQVPIGKGRIDLLLKNGNEKIGIELKIADSSQKLKTLIGQVKLYKRHLSKLIVIILDTGTVKDIKSYIDVLKEEKVKLIVLKGEVRRRGKKTRNHNKILVTYSLFRSS